MNCLISLLFSCGDNPDQPTSICKPRIVLFFLSKLLESSQYNCNNPTWLKLGILEHDAFIASVAVSLMIFPIAN